MKAVDLDDAMREPDTWDIVGVTFHSFSVRYARQIREHFKNAHLVCGGHHPSAIPEQMLSIGYDQVVIGEGENAMIDDIYLESGAPFYTYEQSMETLLSWSRIIMS